MKEANDLKDSLWLIKFENLHSQMAYHEESEKVKARLSKKLLELEAKNIDENRFPLFKKAWVRNTYEGTIGDFTAPIWPIKFIILLGCALLMVQIFLFFMKG